jgi:hypothetical protein
MIKGEFAGSYITLSIDKKGWSSGTWSSGAWSTTTASTSLDQVINIGTGGVWIYKELDMTGITSLTELKFTHSGTGQDVNIDRIQLYGMHREIYTANIVQANFDITKDNTKCDLVLNEYDFFANDADFEYKRQIEKLEAISQDN